MKHPRKQKPEAPASSDAGRGDLADAVDRLSECYRRAVAEKDNRTAFAVQRELNRLLGLGSGETDPVAPPQDAAQGPSPEPPAPDASATEKPPDAPGPEAAPDRRVFESQALADVVAVIEGHLEPLGLSSDVNDTDADLIRLAGEEIQRLRKVAGRTKGKKKKRKSGGKKH